MVKFINKVTGSIMYVDEKRKIEYIAAGHHLVPTVKIEKPTEPAVRKKSGKKK